VPFDLDAGGGAAHRVAAIVGVKLRVLQIEADVAAEGLRPAHELVARHQVELPKLAIDVAANAGGSGVLVNCQAAVHAQQEAAFRHVAAQRHDRLAVPVERLRGDIKAGVELVALRVALGGGGKGDEKGCARCGYPKGPTIGVHVCRPRVAASHFEEGVTDSRADWARRRFTAAAL
jgi:hypothetical protein